MLKKNTTTNNVRQEDMLERTMRIMYEHGETNEKPKHLANKNIVKFENWKQPPKKFNNYDKSTYLSDPDQQQRLVQQDPKTYLSKSEAVLAAFSPSDIKGATPDQRKMVRMAKAKKFRLMNEQKLPAQKQSKKIFENILDNLKKPSSAVRQQYANGGSVASASDDPLYKEYIKEIEIGNLSPDIPFDKWRDQYDEIQLEGPLTKKDKPFDKIESMILNNAIAKIDEAMQNGVSGLIGRMKLEGGGKIIKFSDYKKPRIKELNLADYFKVGMTVANLSESERDLVNELLRRTLGKNPK